MLLQNSIWLWALAAISIPVVIHLWNIRPGKTLKVGSISLFTESSPKSSRSFKLRDILLLLLRCLLLSLLAFLLAAPLWQQHFNAGKTKGWLLIPKENFSEIYRRFKPGIDSISKKGYEFHYFDKGFAKASLAEITQHPGTDTAKSKPANYWALTQQLEGQIPASATAEVFTANTIDHFTGSKPETSLMINWHSFTPADSVSTWIANAWLTTNGNIRVVQGTATPGSTTYQYNDIKNGGLSSAYSVAVENGVPVISLKSAPSEKIKADTSTCRMAIFTDKNGVDANYLKAALDAIGQLTQQKTTLKLYSQADAIPTRQDWIFWLSDKSIDPAIAQKTKQLFTYEGGKVNEVASWISYNGNYSIKQGQLKIPSYKSIVIKKAVGDAIWTDGFGNAVLTLEQNKTNTYHFYSRFNPAWNDLVWNDEFPKWLLELTAKPQPEPADHERRIISAQQLQPVYLNNATITATAQARYIDLSHYLWLLLAVIFLTERWLATKNERILTNG